jgi:hypothetical protein
MAASSVHDAARKKQGGGPDAVGFCTAWRYNPPMLRERMNQAALGMAALVFVWVGVNGLFAPAAITGPVELTAASASAHNEIRANYGGMHLAIGALFVLGTVWGAFRWAATMVLTLFTGGLVVGRLLSMVVDGMPNAFVMQLLATEATAAAAGAALLWAAKD